MAINCEKLIKIKSGHYIIQKTLKYIKNILHRSHKDKLYTNVS